ncbi:MAG: glycosyltransferase [Chlamydiia bacterium]|nr:glycosyltransferase [Chlamydiia bacterium]
MTFDLDRYEELYDRALIEKMDHQEIAEFQAVPAKLDGETLVILAESEITPRARDRFKYLFKVQDIRIEKVSHVDIFMILDKYCKNEIMERTLKDLTEFMPSLSAHYVYSRKQVIWWSVLAALSLAWIYFDVYTFLFVIFFIMQVIYFCVISFRFGISMAGSQFEIVEMISDEEVKALKDESLPLYTVLVPVYKEANILPILIKALKAIDYPPDKLDVLFLMEEDDLETIRKLESIKTPSNWKPLILPDYLPKTKPKACNYGLQFARGKFVTIYDAEDIPDPDQLKKAIIGHAKIGPSCLVVQAALNYYNWNQNLITSLFALEYSYWFDYLLPGLEYFNLPIPLGGTSNHFNTRLLRELGAWDPYNTTEDADLGMRGYATGLKIGTINSTTFEEANSQYWNWIRQRSRWLKGYMQTALVYNRHPIRTLKIIGFKNWIAFQMMITGTPLMLLINPIVWLTFVIWAVGLFVQYFPTFPTWVIYFGFFNLWVSNFIGIYLNMLGVFKRKMYQLIPVAFLNPFYWIFFHSVAAYKALWQLFFKPHYWEKTEHGLSNISPEGKESPVKL